MNPNMKSNGGLLPSELQFMNFMSEDVEVCLNLAQVRALDCVGDRLTVLWVDGSEREYEYVAGVRLEAGPRIEYPDLIAQS